MPVEVCGFVLPNAIAALASDDRWTAYTEQERLPTGVVAELFGEEPDPTWKIYDLDEMRLVTEEWHQEDDPQWFGSAPYDIDVSRSVLIGELGYDRPFALDFRSENPGVRFMTVGGDWVMVAASAEEFVAALGIEGGCS